ncbi:MAG: hypothetical protein BRD40_01485 [Bacteroidetes bacterium QS_1_65_9]|nr:MAG: hypothetical protein BRD40_01485 [Bacteroidetes bacterium QS_1_65_9]
MGSRTRKSGLPSRASSRLKSALDVASRNVDLALERFRLGTISAVRLREIQTSLTEARSRLVDARFEAKRAKITLRRLSGRLLSGRQTADRDTQLAA